MRLSGRTSLTPTAAGSTTVTYDGDLRATVPLFGSAIEQATAGAVRSALEVEQDVARALDRGSRTGAAAVTIR